MIRKILGGALIALGLLGCYGSHEATGGGSAGLGVAPGCDSHETTIYAGRTTAAGTVTVYNTATDLVVEVEGTGDWLVKAVHLYAGTDPVPTNGAGNPAPGRFPYHQEFGDSPVASTTLTVPLAELGVGCDDTLNIAVHTEMVKVVDGVIVEEETGWADGPGEFDGSRWGWWFTYTICCGGDVGCTYTQGYWKNHEAAWPVDSLELGGVTYTKAELLTLLDTPVSGDASLILSHQLIAAKLNVANGAWAEPDVADAIADADAWLAANADADGRLPFGTASGSAAHDEASLLGDALAAFNEGQTETPHCD